jgi:hypothetical protein
MAYEVTNTLRSSSIIRVVDPSTTTIEMANLAFNANETVSSANIKRINWSTNGSVQITRNGAPIATLYGSGELRADDFGHSISNNSTSSIVITIASGGYALIEVSKQATYAEPLVGM